MKITVIGLGYVGTANAALLSRDHEVIALDVDLERVLTINSAHSPIDEPEMDEWFFNQPLKIWATDNARVALYRRDYIVIAVPTSYDESTGKFDTSIVESVVRDAVRYSPRPRSSSGLLCRSASPESSEPSSVARTSCSSLSSFERVEPSETLSIRLASSSALIVTIQELSSSGRCSTFTPGSGTA